MRSQPKRFVVEVKRGTNRAAFASPDPTSEKFSSAEQALFGVPKERDGERQPARDAAAPQPGGRVLPSLIEPPPPVDEPFEAPRRGRKPGSKNKPRPIAPVAPATAPGFEEDGPADYRSIVDQPPPSGDANPSTVGDTAVGSMAPLLPDVSRKRSRLRERSSILKRYVLGTEPGPGQPGRLRARRAAR